MNDEKAKFKLNEVKTLVEVGSYSIMHERARSEVARFYREIGKSKSTEEVDNFIAEGLLSLQEGDFCQKKWQWDLVMDVYGKLIDGHPWYIKFYIEYEENELEEEKKGYLFNVSFHPPKDDMKLANGSLIRKEALK